jgi:glutathione S-transferase
MNFATIIGGPVSPYVRKVIAVCDIKSVRFRIDPIIPFQGNDDFTGVSPLRRIPVFIDDQVTLADSTAICEYLDERYPSPPLFPTTAAARARARWLEEFADTRMGDVFIWRIFNFAVIRPNVWKQPRDDVAIEETLRNELPPVLDYLESVAPEDGFVCGELAIADIAIAVHFANLCWSRITADLSSWPKTTAWIDRVERTPAMAKVTRLGERAMTVRGAERRALYEEMGIALTETTFAAPGFRRGPMSV